MFRMINIIDGKEKIIGECQTSYGAIMGAKASIFAGALKRKDEQTGVLVVRGEHQYKSEVGCKIQYRWENVNNLSKGFLGAGKKRQRVRFQISRELENGSFIEVTTTPCIKQPKDTNFDIPLRIHALNVLCNNDKNAKLRFAVMNKTDNILNEVFTSVAELEKDPKATFKANEGSIMKIEEFELFDRPAFLDYLRGGWGFTLTGAIDYTSSNGNPQGKNSLHYIGPDN